MQLFKKKLAATLALTLCQAMACSTFIVPISNSGTGKTINVVGARTLDFEVQVSSNLGHYGLTGDENYSTVDVNAQAYANALTWKNIYNFVGRSLANENQLVDGINSAGVYAAALYLPDITNYPLYQGSLDIPALSVFDMVNYILGMAASVDDALTQLSKVQLVLSTIYVTPTQHLAFPAHFYLVDKSGQTATIEFIAGKMQVTRNNHVLTNSPSIRWQQDNYAQLAVNFADHNRPIKFDGLYMNGSGYLGVPGDATPPSRYAKIQTMLAAAPTAFSDLQAEYVATAILSAGAFVPIGLNPSPTLWTSKYNLARGTYEITNHIEIADITQKPAKFMLTPPSDSLYQRIYNVATPTQSGVHALLIRVSKDKVIDETTANKLVPGGTELTASSKAAFYADGETIQNPTYRLSN